MMADETAIVLPNECTKETATENGDSSLPPTAVEVQTIIESIKEVSRSSSPASPSSPGIDKFDEFDEGAYWDLSSMAPLNAVSAVSTYPSLRAKFSIASSALLCISRAVTLSMVSAS